LYLYDLEEPGGGVVGIIELDFEKKDVLHPVYPRMVLSA
jgi:hypothetical protein